MKPGRLAGDFGFDPLGIADSKPKLKRMREIELKHARIAMLATIGWPISELFHSQLSELLAPSRCVLVSCLLPPIPQLAQGGRAPSVLNGELLTGPNAIWLGLFGVAYSALEYFLFTNRRSLGRKKNSSAEDGGGDFGYDPLNLYVARGASPKAKLRMRDGELFNGRVAMLTIVTYVLMERVLDKPIIDITPWFFKPQLVWRDEPGEIYRSLFGGS